MKIITISKKHISIILLFVVFLSGVIISCFAVNNDSAKEQEDHPSAVNIENAIVSPYIPDKLTFAGEEVPLDIYFVRERLDRELINVMYQHSRTLQTIKRSARFFPVIEKILQEQVVPEDFKYLCLAESNLENVISPAKATGYWQFLESTAKSYGLTINEDVDERYDIEKSTIAACSYLKGGKSRLGSWTLSAAAYNMGESRLKKSIEQQKTKSYWELYLNTETARYIYRILAYKLIFENLHQYGINVKETDLYYPIPCKEYKIKDPIPDLYQFAQDHGISYFELKTINPWLRNTKLTIGATKYTIQLPVKSGMNYKELIHNQK